MKDSIKVKVRRGDDIRIGTLKYTGSIKGGDLSILVAYEKPYPKVDGRIYKGPIVAEDISGVEIIGVL